jgi:hypothetical protein
MAGMISSKLAIARMVKDPTTSFIPIDLFDSCVESAHLIKTVVIPQLPNLINGLDT